MTSNPWLMLLLGAGLGWSLLSGRGKSETAVTDPVADPEDRDPS
jgi:hypothetical protein